jgi:hypothetical protein
LHSAAPVRVRSHIDFGAAQKMCRVDELLNVPPA